MFNASRISLAREAVIGRMKCPAILVSETGCPYRSISSEAGVLSMRERKFTYGIGAEPPCRARVQLVSPRLGGFILARERAGRSGDKYPFDIMDGVCIQPQRNAWNKSYSFRERFRRRTCVTTHCKSVSSKLILATNIYSLWRRAGVVCIHTQRAPYLRTRMRLIYKYVFSYSQIELAILI